MRDCDILHFAKRSCNLSEYVFLLTIIVEFNINDWIGSLS